eukprot:774637_1
MAARRVAQNEFEVAMRNISNPILCCSLAYAYIHRETTTMYMELYKHTEPDICTLVSNLLNVANSPIRAISLETFENIIQTESIQLQLQSSPGAYQRYIRNYIRHGTQVAKYKGAVYLTCAQNMNFKLTFSENGSLPKSNTHGNIHVLCGQVIKGIAYLSWLMNRAFAPRNLRITRTVQLQKAFIWHYQQSTFPFLTPLKFLTMIIPPSFFSEFYAYFPLTILHEIMSYIPLKSHTDAIGVKGMAFVLNQHLSTKFHTLAQMHTRTKPQPIEHKENDEHKHYILSMIYFNEFVCGKKKIFLPFVRRDLNQYSALKELKSFLIFGQSYKKYQRFVVHNIVNDELFVCCNDAFMWLSRRFCGFWIVDDGTKMVTLFRSNRYRKRKDYVLCQTNFMYNKYRQSFGMELKVIHRLIRKSKHKNIFDLDVQKYTNDKNSRFKIQI